MEDLKRLSEEYQKAFKDMLDKKYNDFHRDFMDPSKVSNQMVDSLKYSLGYGPYCKVNNNPKAEEILAEHQDIKMYKNSGKKLFRVSVNGNLLATEYNNGEWIPEYGKIIFTPSEKECSISINEHLNKFNLKGFVYTGCTDYRGNNTFFFEKGDEKLHVFNNRKYLIFFKTTIKKEIPLDDGR
jgi:hypothetical protein